MFLGKVIVPAHIFFAPVLLVRLASGPVVPPICHIVGGQRIEFGQERTRSQVITVGETAWNDQKSVVKQAFRSLEQMVDVEQIGLKTDLATCMGCLAIAVNAGGT